RPAQGAAVLAHGERVPKKARCLGSSQTEIGAAEKAQIVLELRQHFPLADLLSVAGLPRSTFYYQWRAGQAGDKYASFKARIRAIFEQHQGRYGYPRITGVVRQQGWPVNHKIVQRISGVQRVKACVAACECVGSGRCVSIL